MDVPVSFSLKVLIGLKTVKPGRKYFRRSRSLGFGAVLLFHPRKSAQTPV
jgi:hypothetical protein